MFKRMSDAERQKGRPQSTLICLPVKPQDRDVLEEILRAAGLETVG